MAPARGAVSDPAAEADVAPGPAASDGRPRGRSRQAGGCGSLVGTLTLLLIVVALAAQFVTLPFVVLRPGPIVDIIGTPEEGAPVVEVEGAETYPTDGALFFTTVAQYGGPDRRPSAWDVLTAALTPQAQVVPEARVFPPDVTSEQVREQNVSAMTHSQEGAVAVALRALGRDVGETAVVAQVMADMPADGVLRADDVITAVDGEPIGSSAEVAERVQNSTGDVEMTIVRDDAEQTLTLTPADRDGRRLVGVLITPSFDFGIDVAIHAGDVGGPSAGMMFALGVYDTLTPGALTGGESIAGTGTIDTAGAVGEIGGVVQKMDGALDGGAGYFLAPAGNCGEVTGNEPDGLVVTPVATFDEALSAVEAIAAGQGGSLPRCQGTVAGH